MAESRIKGSVSLKNKDMEAWLRLEPAEDGEPYDYGEISDFLDKAGVIYGVNSSRINAMIQKKIYGREVLVASGLPPEEGEDGRYEFIFDMETNKKPVIREDGSVDYASVNVITCVTAGDIIAMYHPAIKGKAGSSVKAKIVPPKPTRDLKALYPVNVTYNSENMIYRANIDGRVELTKSQIKISDVQEYTADIDNVHGDIVFKGDVIIHGAVEPGVSIKATKSITVDKTVESAMIEAGGDVLIRGGILGGGKTVIKAAGNVNADFIEYATIEADGDVHANYILDSNVVVKGEVVTTGKLGAIVGGNVYGMLGINTKLTGNDTGIKTIVAAGVRDSVYQNKIMYERQIKATAEIIKSMEAQEEELERKIRLGTANDMEVHKRSELMKARIEKTATLNEAKQNLAEFGDLLGRCRGARIYVEDTAFPGTVVQVDAQQIVVENEEKRRVEFRLDENNELIMRGVTNYV